MNGTLPSWVHYIELRGAQRNTKGTHGNCPKRAEVIADVFPLMKSL